MFGGSQTRKFILSLPDHLEYEMVIMPGNEMTKRERGGEEREEQKNKKEEGDKMGESEKEEKGDERRDGREVEERGNKDAKQARKGETCDSGGDEESAMGSSRRSSVSESSTSVEVRRRQRKRGKKGRDEAGVVQQWNLCVSSQVGCRLGCAFCETGRMGLLRSLTAGEITSQVFFAKYVLGLDVKNVVFMGMGEPLDSAVIDSVFQAIRVLTEPSGFGLPASAITVSTSGCVPGIRRVMKELPFIHLAFSIHAGHDEIRTKIMPVARRYPLSELTSAIADYLQQTKWRITLQYVLLAGVNDTVTATSMLLTFLSSLPDAKNRVHVNLIPYNPQSQPLFKTPAEEEVKRVKTALRKEGYFVKIRVEKGRDKMAACGQLGNIGLKKRMLANTPASPQSGILEDW
uniref:Radical SAM core domain-containing protein n=1 Tax=Palpitomonas bilix TaxID=652834 RepID=A0A7S3D5C7_9EUKA